MTLVVMGPARFWCGWNFSNDKEAMSSRQMCTSSTARSSKV